ncbi:MAG: AAA family ATPase [Anaerolineae bacterium]|nr:AAA family ATPase [Anaerolineae bacterium]
MSHTYQTEPKGNLALNSATAKVHTNTSGSTTSHQHIEQAIQQMATNLQQCALRYGNPLVLAKAPTHIGSVVTFTVDFAKGKLSDLQNLETEFARWMHVGSCLVTQDTNNGAALIQVQAPVTMKVFVDESTAIPYNGLKVELGPLVAGTGSATVDLGQSDTAHALIVGTTGSGKTTLAHTWLYQLMRQNNPHQLRLLLVDPNGNRIHSSLDQVPWLLHPIIRGCTPETVYTIAWVADEVRRRNRANQPAYSILLYIDELATLTAPELNNLVGIPGASDIVINSLHEILQNGRVCDVHVIAATQYANKSTIGSSFLRGQFNLRLVGSVTNAIESNLATGEAGYECHKLYGNGDFIRVGRGFGCGRFQCAKVRNRALESMPRVTNGASLDLSSYRKVHQNDLTQNIGTQGFVTPKTSVAHKGLPPARIIGQGRLQQTQPVTSFSVRAGLRPAPKPATNELDIASTNEWDINPGEVFDIGVPLVSVDDVVLAMRLYLKRNPQCKSHRELSRNKWQRMLWPDQSTGGANGTKVSKAMEFLDSEKQSNELDR